MKTSERDKPATFTKKQFVAFLIATVALSVLVNEILAKTNGYRSWWLLVVIVGAPVLAGISTLMGRRSRKSSERR
jgi:uncharacterized membrane protein